MGGGGGGGTFNKQRTPEKMAQMIRKNEDNASSELFDVELSSVLSELLSSANSRDTELVGERLDDIKIALGDALDDSIDTLFGGSVAKHTYVDGLSDVDSLIILNDTGLDGLKPSDAISRVEEIVKVAVENSAEVSSGKLAVTVEYSDGMEIQILPAFRTGEGLKVPSFSRDGWSNIVPENFQKALSERNAACGGKLVPTIKLAKAVIATLPVSQQLSGYHVESLTIAAFRGYQGTKTTAEMLPHFFEKARSLVSKPITDSTGQSVHVDNYLGAAGSIDRGKAGHILDRIAKRMRNASAYESVDQWKAILGNNNG